MNPTNFPIPARMRMVGGDFHFIKGRVSFCKRKIIIFIKMGKSFV